MVFKKTVDSLHQIIASDSMNSTALFDLGLTLRHEGQWIESIECYKKAISIDSNVSKYYVELAYSQKYLKYHTAPIENYQKAYTLDSNLIWIPSTIEFMEKN